MVLSFLGDAGFNQDRTLEEERGSSRGPAVHLPQPTLRIIPKEKRPLADAGQC